MKSETFSVGQVKGTVQYDSEKSPVRVTLGNSEHSTPAMGAMAYAVPSGKYEAPVTLLRDYTEFNEIARQLAKSLAQKLERPAFVSTSVPAGREVVNEILDLIS